MLRLLLLLCTVVICWSAVCFGFGYGYGHNWTSVTAPLSATAETRKKTGFGRSLEWNAADDGHYFLSSAVADSAHSGDGCPALCLEMREIYCVSKKL